MNEWMRIFSIFCLCLCWNCSDLKNWKSFGISTSSGIQCCMQHSFDSSNKNRRFAFSGHLFSSVRFKKKKNSNLDRDIQERSWDWHICLHKLIFAGSLQVDWIDGVYFKIIRPTNVDNSCLLWGKVRYWLWSSHHRLWGDRWKRIHVKDHWWVPKPCFRVTFLQYLYRIYPLKSMLVVVTSCENSTACLQRNECYNTLVGYTLPHTFLLISQFNVDMQTSLFFPKWLWCSWYSSVLIYAQWN